jgi:hypothetical protein
MTLHESSVITCSPQDSLHARNELFAVMNSYPATDEEKERSIGLFIRGSLLARILAVGDIFKKIVSIPGIIIDMGTWRGQTAVLCENFRAIYEPLHFNRRIVCFDTFEGYKGFSEEDNPTQLHRDGTYAVGGASYASLLENILRLHERSNAMGHNNGKHLVIAGDCRETLPSYFSTHSNEIVSLAFFDLNCYEPTLEAFDIIYKRIVPGGIIAFWQLTRGDAVQAEGKVYADHILNSYPHEICRSSYYPGLCYLIKK